MKLIAVVMTSLTLLGCRADQEQQGAQCKFEAQKTYPNVENMYLSMRAGEFIELCMNAAGYDFDYDNLNWLMSAPVVSEKPNPYCYKPRSSLGRLGQALENLLEGRKISN